MRQAKLTHFQLIIIILILSTVLTAVYIGKVPGGNGHDGYLEIAHSIAGGDGFSIADTPVTGRSPAYPYILSFGLWIGLGIYTPWFVNFGSIFTAAIYQKKTIERLGISNSTWLSLLIACNPLMLWLATNSMPYAFASLLLSLAIYGLIGRTYICSALSLFVLFFTHPSFGFMSILTMVYLVYASNYSKIIILICIFFATSVIMLNFNIKSQYGAYPIFSSSGAGFQYLRAKNQYEKDQFDDKSIFERSGLTYDPNKVEFSVVSNDNLAANKVDSVGIKTLLKDLENVPYFTMKLASGFINTVFGGLFPDYIIVAFVLLLIFFILNISCNDYLNMRSQSKQHIIFLTFIFFIHLLLLSVVGFKMRYSAYFLPIYHFFPVVFSSLSILVLWLRQRSGLDV